MIMVGDCREVLASCPDEYFDCIIADPPYVQTSLEWDVTVAGWQQSVRRVLKKTGSMWVFGSLKMFMRDAEQYKGFKFAQDIVWEKHNGSGFAADRFRRVHEQAVQFYRDDAKWGDVYNVVPKTMDARPKVVRRKERPTHMGVIENSTYISVDGGPRLMRSVIYQRSEHGRAAHPTQKPEGIVEPLLECSCPPGGRVLDPFSGSGTVEAVALRLGRQPVSIEKDQQYADFGAWRTG